MLINKIRDDLRNECSKHGDVRKVIIYDVSYLCTSVDSCPKEFYYYAENCSGNVFV